MPQPMTPAPSAEDGWEKVKRWALGGAQTLAGMAAPVAGSPLAAGVAGIRSVLPGGGTYEEERERYDMAANPNDSVTDLPSVALPGEDQFDAMKRWAGSDQGMRQTMNAATMAAPIRDPRLAPAFTPKMRELLDDPPESLDAFVPMSEFRNRYRSQYQGENAGTKNSRFDPSTETLPAGTWVVDDMKGIHGREVGYVTKIDPEPVQISEFLPERADDVARYAEWNRSGMEPPPVSALETDKGALKIGDGHRRRLAAIESGTQLPAVVWPTGPHPEGLAEFGKTDPMRVGLTFEMLQKLRASGQATPEAYGELRRRFSPEEAPAAAGFQLRGEPAGFTRITSGGLLSDEALGARSTSSAYRGVTQAEMDAISKSGKVRSNESWSTPGEGTNFADNLADAASYASSGRTNPTKTGVPTYVVEVPQEGLTRWKDGYLKAPEVDASRIQRVWKFNPDGTVEVGSFSSTGRNP